jgi:hypothetical protein
MKKKREGERLITERENAILLHDHSNKVCSIENTIKRAINQIVERSRICI